MKKSSLLILVTFFISVLFSATSFAEETVKKSTGQTVYLPAMYNDLSSYTDQGKKVIDQMGVTRIIVRNTDLYNDISLVSVKFYGPDGELVKEYLSENENIPPLASVNFRAFPGVVGRQLWGPNDGRPSFVVEWVSETPVTQPIIESGRIIVRSVKEGVYTDAIDTSLGAVIK